MFKLDQFSHAVAQSRPNKFSNRVKVADPHDNSCRTPALLHLATILSASSFSGRSDNFVVNDVFTSVLPRDRRACDVTVLPPSVRHKIVFLWLPVVSAFIRIRRGPLVLPSSICSSYSSRWLRWDPEGRGHTRKSTSRSVNVLVKGVLLEVSPCGSRPSDSILFFVNSYSSFSIVLCSMRYLI